jgi:hypothetical protein
LETLQGACSRPLNRHHSRKRLKFIRNKLFLKSEKLTL